MKDCKITKNDLKKSQMTIRQTLARKGAGAKITPKKGK